jgi:transcriptional regulator with XRE-family HTH domain
MSRAELSLLVGVSQPQMFRYEAGRTRVAASRLIAIASALGVSVGSLTGGADRLDLLLHSFSRIAPSERRNSLLPITDAIADAELRIGGEACAEIELLLRAFSDIAQPELRSALLALARALADTAAPRPTRAGGNGLGLRPSGASALQG